MFDLVLETALVTNIDDKDKQGKVQINIESKFKNIKKDLLPWAIPLFSNTSNSTMSFNPPVVNSQIWVLRDKYWKRFYYLTNRYFYNLFDFSKVNGLLDKCEKINKDYKNITFNYFADKTVIFHNNSDGSTGIINSQGTLLYIDKDGSFVRNVAKDEISEIKGNEDKKIKGKSTVEISGDSSFKCNGKETKTANSFNYTSKGDIKLKSTTPSLVEIGNAVSTLGSILVELCTDLSGLVTVGTRTSHTSPTLSGQMATLIPKIKTTFK